MAAKAGVRMGLNEVGLGLAFPPRTLAMIRAQLAAPLAERVMLGAELHDASAARAMGLVDEAVEDARAAAMARLEALARLPRDAYARAKRALRGAALELSREDERRFEEETLPLWTTTAPAAARRALGR
jgi:enoyl-CoA hydratase/carnithine racemase